ncbi:MAG: acetyl-CoA C-acetyltransferase [Oceanococcus sp.]
MTSARKVAIVGGARIPFCRSNTAYAKLSNHQMLTAALNALSDKYNLAGKTLGEVAGGTVLKLNPQDTMTREAVMESKLANNTPAYDVGQYCGTSLETVILVANKIALGQIDCGIAAGTDTTSDAPVGVNEGLRKIFMEVNRAKTGAQRAKALAKIRPKHVVPSIPQNAEARTGKSMGQACEDMTQAWGIPREEQDQLAFESHKKAAAAYDEGFFDDLVFPCNGVQRDNNMRPDTSLEKLASLKPCFSKSDAATLTAANSTPLTDGAAAVFLCSEEYAKKHKLPVQAYFITGETAAIDYVNGNESRDNFVRGSEGLLMAPAQAVPNMLERMGLSFDDIDFFEIHEAFAAQVLCTMKAWEDPKFCKQYLGRDKPVGKVPREKLNVKGSSLAYGHPFGATGARIVGTLAKILEENKKGRGLISVCTAGGMGVAAIIERP